MNANYVHIAVGNKLNYVYTRFDERERREPHRYRTHSAMSTNRIFASIRENSFLYVSVVHVKWIITDTDDACACAAVYIYLTKNSKIDWPI